MEEQSLGKQESPYSPLQIHVHCAEREDMMPAKKRGAKRRYRAASPSIWMLASEDYAELPTDAEDSPTEEPGSTSLVEVQPITQYANPSHPIAFDPAMNSLSGAQPQTRQGPQLRNTQKSALGNGLGGWNTAGSGFGLGGGLGGGLGSGLGGSRPAQLSGFAQVMGGGQGPIDMR